MLLKTTLPKEVCKTDEPNLYAIESPGYLVINDFDDFTSSAFLSSFNRVANSQCPYVGLALDSYGGSVFALLGIKNIIEASDKIIVTNVQSMAMSSAAVLLSCGTKGYRYASKDAIILVHQASTHLEGKSSDVMNSAKNLEEMNEKTMEILAKNCGKPRSFFTNLVKKANNADLYFSAEECLKHGIIDHIGVPQLEMDVKVEYKLNNVTKKEKPVTKPRQKVTKSKPAKE